MDEMQQRCERVCPLGLMGDYSMGLLQYSTYLPHFRTTARVVEEIFENSEFKVKVTGEPWGQGTGGGEGGR